MCTNVHFSVPFVPSSTLHFRKPQLPQQQLETIKLISILQYSHSHIILAFCSFVLFSFTDSQVSRKILPLLRQAVAVFLFHSSTEILALHEDGKNVLNKLDWMDDHGVGVLDRLPSLSFCLDQCSFNAYKMVVKVTDVAIRMYAFGYSSNSCHSPGLLPYVGIPPSRRVIDLNPSYRPFCNRYHHRMNGTTLLRRKDRRALGFFDARK